MATGAKHNSDMAEQASKTGNAFSFSKSLDMLTASVGGEMVSFGNSENHIVLMCGALQMN